MKIRVNSLLATLVTCVLIVHGMAGCGNSSSTTASNGNATADQSAIRSDAAALDANSDPGEAAKQTVAVFLDCLRRGDETTANSMLTSKAREELKKTAWVMQPLGTPEGKFTIGRAGFPYQDQSAVLIESRWQEPNAPGTPEIVMDIVCELYQEAEGWRIAGMAVNLPGEEDALVIDFENGQKLQEMLDLANSPNSNNSPAQGAVSPSQLPNPASNTQLPSLPEFPANNGSQIASPPNSAGVLR